VTRMQDNAMAGSRNALSPDPRNVLNEEMSHPNPEPSPYPQMTRDYLGRVVSGEEAMGSLNELADNLRRAGTDPAALLDYVGFGGITKGAKDLAVTHNLSESNLRFADEFGGLPVPSMAVVHKDRPMSSFGDITLIGDEAMATPSAKNPFYRTDAYSPRFPKVTNKYNSKEMDNLASNIIGEDLEALGSSPYNFMDNLSSRDGLMDLRDSNAVKRKFLRMKGKDVTPVRYARELTPVDTLPELGKFKDISLYEAHENKEFTTLYKKYITKKYKDRSLPKSLVDELKEVNPNSHSWSNFVHSVKNHGKQLDVDNGRTSRAYDDLIGDKTAFNEWTENLYKNLQPEGKLWGGHTPAGRERWKPATQANILKEMKGNVNAGEGWNYGMGTYRASLSPRIKSLKEMRGMKGSLVTNKEMASIKDDLDLEFGELYERLNSYDKYPASYTGLGDTMERLTEINKGQSRWADYYDDVPQDLVDDIAAFNDKLVKSPSEYFEGKPQRMVDLSEFKGAIIPEDASQNTIDLLKKYGIDDFRKYKNADDRVNKLKEFRNLLFQVAPVGVLGAAMLDEENR